MQRRRFLQALIALGFLPDTSRVASATLDDIYRFPSFGNASILHFTDCHAQLTPVYYREPDNESLRALKGNQFSLLAGLDFLDFFGITPNNVQAHAFTSLNFVEAAEQYGKMGGFSYLATLVKQMRAERGEENTVLLDGGDSWQGSATALWTQGQDMVGASNLLAVDAMTGHWEFTYGERQVKENLAQFQGEFLGQNVTLTEEAAFRAGIEQGPVFKPYVIKQLAKARIAVIGQAFPYTPIANPRYLMPDWQFGIQEQKLQQQIDEIRDGKVADAVVLLSHNGLAVDLKLAARVSGLDVILGGHTHHALPRPITVSNARGKTLVTNAGSHGKFLAVLDLVIKAGSVRDFRYRLVPVFSNFLAADQQMAAYIKQVRAPYLQQLSEPLAQTERLLYRRDSFGGPFDQLILLALQQATGCQIVLSPGFRWGSSLLPGDCITVEDVFNHTAITYPETYQTTLTGGQLKTLLEDVGDNLFNPDPYYQQGGDMVRVSGMHYRCHPTRKHGERISEMRLDSGELIESSKHYSVAGWATTQQQSKGLPVWSVVIDYLRQRSGEKIAPIYQSVTVTQ